MHAKLTMMYWKQFLGREDPGTSGHHVPSLPLSSIQHGLPQISIPYNDVFGVENIVISLQITQVLDAFRFNTTTFHGLPLSDQDKRFSFTPHLFKLFRKGLKRTEVSAINDNVRSLSRRISRSRGLPIGHALLPHLIQPLQ